MILLATLTGLSVKPEYVGMPRRFYSARNKRAATFYENTKKKSLGHSKVFHTQWRLPLIIILPTMLVESFTILTNGSLADTSELH
jgi:hypothetical protein